MIAAVLLSAGASRRMGTPKALLPFEGEPLAVAHFRALRRCGVDPLRIVLGAQAGAIRSALPLARENFVVNRRHGLGQLSSLQAGLAALAEDPTWPAVLLQTVDSLPVSPAVFRALERAWQGSAPPAAKPTHRGQGGHPVLISRSLCRRILRLDPRTDRLDLFLRSVEVQRIPVRDAAVLANLNSPDVYRRALQRSAPLPR